jgi:hypothetical protein
VIRFENGDRIRKISDRTVNRIREKCIEYDTVRGPTNEGNEVCVSLVDGTLMRLRQRTLKGPCTFGCGLRETEWSDYASFRDKLYPRHVALKAGGTKIIEADVEFTEGTDLVPATFSIPSKFESRRACDLLSPPVRIQGKAPDYPDRVGEIRYVGGMLVQARIGVDGHVQDAQAIRNKAYATQPGPPLHPEPDNMTKAVMEVEQTFLYVVKHWIFEPAKCDGAPVVENILIPFKVNVE